MYINICVTELSKGPEHLSFLFLGYNEIEKFHLLAEVPGRTDESLQILDGLLKEQVTRGNI